MKNNQKIIILVFTSIPFVAWRIWSYRGKFGLNEILVMLFTYILISFILWLVLRIKKSKKNR